MKGGGCLKWTVILVGLYLIIAAYGLHFALVGQQVEAKIQEYQQLDNPPILPPDFHFPSGETIAKWVAVIGGMIVLAFIWVIGARESIDSIDSLMANTTLSEQDQPRNVSVTWKTGRK